MSYLFDKRGTPDEDLTALEERLAAARMKTPAVSWEHQARSTASRRSTRVMLALAALLLTVLGAAFLLSERPTLELTTASGSSRLALGRWLETTERAELVLAAEIGRVTIEPSSRIRLVESTEHRQRLELERGTVHARVSAPPRLFVVDTPAAQAVDLGCEYRLSVEPSGATRLEVLTGEVSLENHGIASRVHAGAIAVTERGKTPGVPRARETNAAFATALEKWEADRASLEPVLAAAERRDAPSLWNLLARIEPSERAAVFTRLKTLINEVGVSELEIIQLNALAMETLWMSATRQSPVSP